MTRRAMAAALATALALLAAAGPGIAQPSESPSRRSGQVPRAERAPTAADAGAPSAGHAADAPEPPVDPAISGQDTIRSFQGTGYDNIWHPGLEAPPTGSPSATPRDEAEFLGRNTPSLVDERPLWRLLSAQEYRRVREWLEKFREWYPDYEPSEELVVTLVQGELFEAIQNARAQGDWAQLVALAQQHPEEFTCEKIYNLWALTDAHVAMDAPDRAVAILRGIVTACPRAEDRLVSLQRLVTKLSFTTLAELISLEADQARDEAADAAFQAFRFAFHAQWLADALGRRAFTEGRVAAQATAPRVIETRDAETAALLGWFELRQNRHGDAIAWFSRAFDWAPTGANAYPLALALMRAGRFDRAEAIAERWAAEHRPLAELLVMLRATPAQRAFDRGDYAEALELARRSLRRLGSGYADVRPLRRIEGWSLLNLERPREALAVFEDLYRARPDRGATEGVVLSALAAGDPAAVERIAAALGGPLAQIVALAPAEPLDADAQDLRYRVLSARAAAALADGDPAAALRYAQAIRDAIRQRHDAATLGVLGWSHRQLAMARQAVAAFREALSWQPSPDLALGLALSLQDAGETGAAEAVARAWASRAPELAALAGDLILGRADRACAAGDHDRALALIEEAVAHAGHTRRAEMLRAWSIYGRGDLRPAADLFEVLYRAAPDDPSAEGLVFASLALDDDARVAHVVATVGGPLERRWRAALAERYFNAGKFLLASRVHPGPDPRLAGLETPQATLFPYAGWRSGAEGLDRLTQTGTLLAAERPVGDHHVRVTLKVLRLDAGRLDTERLFDGIAPADRARLVAAARPFVQPGAARPRVRLERGVVPGIEIRPIGMRGLRLSLGATPLGGPLAPRPTGAIEWESRERRGAWRVGLFSQSVTDSVLSLVGSQDEPFSEASWGRVVESGGRAGLLRELSPSWTLNAGLGVGWRHGRDVKGNLHVAVEAGVSRNLRIEGFRYLTIGPVYSFDHFRDNLSRFFRGHGGYFSPSQFHRFGLSTAFQTAEGRDFILQGSAGVGWERITEADTVAFPLTGTGPRIAGSNTHGFAWNAELQGVLRVSSQVSVGFRSAVRHSGDAQALAGGLFLRLSLGPRGGGVQHRLAPRALAVGAISPPGTMP